MRVIACFICMLSLMLGGCFESETPAGIVATVNGKPIVLKIIQASQEADMVDFGIFEQFSLHELRAQYGKTLANLIVYEMMAQELESKGIIITDAMIRSFEEDIRKDYPQGEFEKYFEEKSIDMDSWREMIRYIIVLQKFTSEFLRKNFVPELKDVREYYEKHKESFVIAENYDVYVATSETKEALEGIESVDEFLEKKQNLTTYKMRIDKGNIPKEGAKSVPSLKEKTCTKILKEEEAFTLVCLDKHQKEKTLSPSEAYIYIEDFLAEEHLVHIFEKWLTEKLPQTEIKVSAHVINDI